MNIDLFRNEETLTLIRQSEQARGRDARIVDSVAETDKDWRESSHKLQQLKTQFNVHKRNVAHIKKEQGAKADIRTDVDAMKELKQMITVGEEYVQESKERLDNLLGAVGNIVHESVPVSQNEDNNKVIKYKKLPAGASSMGEAMYRDGMPVEHHSDAMLRLNMYFSASAMSGHRSFFLKGYGVLLNQALIQYGLRFLSDRSYTMLQTPFMMTQECMAKTAQLSEFNELLYSVGDSSKNSSYLIATSEQPLSCIHQNEWLQKNELPIRYAGYSTCFRKEAGAHGKDVKGLFRVHQFEKVEQFVLCAPDESWQLHEEMLKISEEFLQSLDIPYRVVSIVSGALNDAAAKKYDIEGYFPSTVEFRELVSCSNCTDYQSRKLAIRYGHKESDKKAEYIHMLNSTLCATERLMCCLVENHQQPNGSVRIPQVLQSYMGGLEFIK